MPIVRTRLFKGASGVCLVALAVVVWSWDVSSELLTSQLHTTTASATRQTPLAPLNNLVLTMGIMMPETC